MSKSPPDTQIKRAAGLSFRGLKVPAIAQALNVSNRTIVNWKKTKVWRSEIEAWEDLERRETFDLARESFDFLAGELITLRRMITSGLRVQVQAGTTLGVASLAAIEKIQADNEDPVAAMRAIQEVGCGYALQTSGQVLKGARELLDQSYAIGTLSDQLSQVLGNAQDAQLPAESFNPQEETDE